MEKVATRRIFGCLLTASLCASCGGGLTLPLAVAPVTAPAATPAPTPPKPSFDVPLTFDVSGSVVGDDGAPVRDAEVYVSYVARNRVPGQSNQTLGGWTTARTNAAGDYQLTFTALPEQMFDGSQWVNASIRVSQPDFDTDFRYLLTRDARATHHVRLHRRRRAAAGQPMDVTVTPDDPVCVNNMQDEPGLGALTNTLTRCRVVRVSANENGVMTVEAFPASGGARPVVEVESSADNAVLGNPASIRVSAGDSVAVSVQIPWNSPVSQTFTLTTSIAR